MFAMQGRADLISFVLLMCRVKEHLSSFVEIFLGTNGWLFLSCLADIFTIRVTFVPFRGIPLLVAGLQVS